MTEDEVVRTLREYFESLFPKVCPNCNRCFATLREYIQGTKRLGPTISYDGDLGNWETALPIGSVAMANCPCGTTLGLTTGNMPLPLRLEMLNWVKTETQRRGVSPSDLLEYFRDEVRKRVLGDSIPGDK
jgi:hypothetical protein